MLLPFTINIISDSKKYNSIKEIGIKRVFILNNDSILKSMICINNTNTTAGIVYMQT